MSIQRPLCENNKQHHYMPKRGPQWVDLKGNQVEIVDDFKEQSLVTQQSTVGKMKQWQPSEGFPQGMAKIILSQLGTSGTDATPGQIVKAVATYIAPAGISKEQDEAEEYSCGARYKKLIPMLEEVESKPSMQLTSRHAVHQAMIKGLSKSEIAAYNKLPANPESQRAFSQDAGGEKLLVMRND